MKIALVIPGFQADADDWRIPAFTNLARELSAAVDLHVFALRYPQRRGRYQVGRVQVHALGGAAFSGLALALDFIDGRQNLRVNRIGQGL